ALKKAVLLLANQVENMSVQLKKATTSPNHIKKLPPSPVLTFTLRAIIPGRAWVTGSNGEEDSVAVGSKLKNYGTVKAIEVNAGKVLTTSGKVITYNADGN
ncbi:MAG: type IV secretion protein IcmG, partial [Coxiellaceae bacterium]|nr:type IV secretion protein IcmG [Coxiellaceae bacterium]